MKLLILIGMPGCGKTTYAQKYKEIGYKVHSADAVREEIFRKKYNIPENEECFIDNAIGQATTPKAMSIMKRRTVSDLKDGFNVVFDACNTKLGDRRRLINYIRENVDDVEIIGIYFDKSLDYCIKMNEQREYENNTLKRNVPISVIENMHNNLRSHKPSLEDGFDKLEIITDIEKDIVREL